MNKIYWLGPREADCSNTGTLINGSVTFYGSNKNGNSAYCSNATVRVNHNLYSANASDFILKWQLEKIEQEPECCFMSYNPNCVFGAPESIIKRTVCLNNEQLMHDTSNKILMRDKLSKLVQQLPGSIFSGKECLYANLRSNNLFSGFDSFVIQEPVSSGGQGTYLLTEENASVVQKIIDPEAHYHVTGYQKHNIPINLHAVIFDNHIQLFPASVQIISFDNHRLLYRGADYISYKEISSSLQNTFSSMSKKICQYLQELGYRGVVGVDGIIAKNSVYFLEINNRFQGSSFLLNKALSEQGLPSLQLMNLYAFQGKTLEKQIIDKISHLDVPYSFYTYFNDPTNKHAQFLFQRLQQNSDMEHVEEVLTEGYDNANKQDIELFATLFSVVFNSNITSLCDESTSVRIHQNIKGTTNEWNTRILAHDWTVLKVALINQGIIIADDAKRYIACHGAMRSGTYFSLDLFVKGIYINCPLSAKYTQFSPFELVYDVKKECLVLNYYGSFLTEVEYDVKKSFPKANLSNGVPIEEICFLATDRLRLQNSPVCTFPSHGVACKFCEANQIRNHFTEDNILEAIDIVFQSKEISFRHILIGGLSNNIGKEVETIQKMCLRIRQYTNKPIYLMCLPPKPDDVKEYYKAGVTEFGFNLEVFNRELAEKYMPGKGAIPIEQYFKALTAATECVGKKGNVRCAFVAGLEPMDSLLNGIEQICKIGVQPILSPFRPIAGTEMENVIPPDNTWLLNLLEKSETICQRYGLSLGPDCPACRNNTLAYAKENEVAIIYSDQWKRDFDR